MILYSKNGKLKITQSGVRNEGHPKADSASASVGNIVESFRQRSPLSFFKRRPSDQIVKKAAARPMASQRRSQSKKASEQPLLNVSVADHGSGFGGMIPFEAKILFRCAAASGRGSPRGAALPVMKLPRRRLLLNGHFYTVMSCGNGLFSSIHAIGLKYCCQTVDKRC